MKIDFERTGGFAGITVKKTIDTDKLPPEEAKNLQQLVEASDFSNLPKEIVSSKPAPDRFQYTLTVEENGKKHTVDVDEASAPLKMKPLLQQLTKSALKS